MLNKYVKPVLAVAVLAVSAGAVANAQSVKGTITLKAQPEQLAVDPYNNRIYVAATNFGEKPYDYLTIIDGSKDAVVKNIEIPPYGYAVAVDPIAQKVYVGGTTVDKNGVDQSEIVVICALQKVVTGTIHVSSTTGDGILSLAVNPLNGDLYVANGSDNEIDVIAKGKVTSRISVAGEPSGVAVNPFSNTVYAALLNGNVSVIAGATNTVTTTTAIGDVNAEVAVDILTGNVYTTNNVYEPSSTVGVLTGTGAVTTTVAVGNTPLGIDVDPILNLVWVVNSQDGTVDSINGATNTVSATLPVSGLFDAVNLVSEKVYVTNPNLPSITVLSEK